MTSFLTNLAAFIALISILVAVHEYGHYIVGRWSGMKVLRFSIGFGKKIWAREVGEDKTEYCLSVIPLGGYVKFLDSREEVVKTKDIGRAFNQRPVPARIAVLLAGPAFNFIFAILAYWLLMAGGTMILKPAIGVVEANSYADQAGLEFGDKIIRVGDMAAIEWESTLAAILGEMVDDGRVPLTLAGSDGRERQTTLQVGSDKSRLTEPGALFDGLGFVPWQPPAIIATLSQDGPAISSGLAIGDRITTIDGETIGSFEDLRISVQPRAGKEVIVEFIREEQPGVVDVQIGERIINDKSQGYLGVGWSNEGGEDFYQRVDYTLLESLNSAINRTWTSTIFTINMLGGMLTGDVSIKNISGPIKIAQIAGESAERGWRYFVGIMAIISISLGVLNLLPIPVLDGGQIIYQLIEGFKGSPMTERAQIIGQQAGILALLMLMSFAFYNDISGILS